MGESLCSGFSPLLWSSTSLYQTSRFITAWGKSPTTFIFIIKMPVDYTIMRGLTKITAKENPFAGFPLPLCSPALLHWTTSLCHHMRRVSSISLSLHERDLQQSLILTASGFTSTSSLNYISLSLHEESFRRLFVTTWEGSPTVTDSHCLWIHQHFFTALHLFVITRGEFPASLCHYMRGISNSHWFSLPLGSPALLHCTTSLCHYTRRVSGVSLSLHERGLQQSLILTASGFTSTSSLMSSGSLFVTTWEGSPTVADSHCLWVHHLSGELQHYMRGFSNNVGCNLNHFAHPTVNCKFSIWLIIFYLIRQHLFFAEQCSLDSPVAVCFIFTPSTVVACVLFASLIKLAAFLLGQRNETLKGRKLNRWLNFIFLFIVFVKMWWDCQCFSSKRVLYLVKTELYMCATDINLWHRININYNILTTI